MARKVQSGAKITVGRRARLELFNVIQPIRPTTMAEQRANNRLFREFGLIEIEGVIAIATPPAPPAGAAVDSSEVSNAINTAVNAAFTTGEDDLEISEVGAAIFRSYMDKMGEVYPSGITSQGIRVPAGMPMHSSRLLAPLVDALDAAFPPPPPPPAKATEGSEP